MSTLGDRREHARLEVIGSFRATLEISHPVDVLNVGRGGALVRTWLPALVDSIRPITLRLRGERVQIRARVCHLTLTTSQDAGSCYQMGVEFLDMPEASAATFD